MFGAGLTVFGAVWGGDVLFTGAGLDNSAICAIRTNVPADPFSSTSGKTGRVFFEVPYRALPGTPGKANTIEEASGERWSVIDIDRHDDVCAYHLWVEKL